jgi:hypothetical protein
MVLSLAPGRQNLKHRIEIVEIVIWDDEQQMQLRHFTQRFS